jgi:proteasome accessory factor B
MAPIVRSRIWHDSQETSDLPNGGVRLTLNVSDDWALRSWLLGFGAAARVVAPEALASALIEECRNTLRAYEK